MNPVRVEPKVWLANQRTFVKWQHISVLLAALSLGLYNAAGEHNNVARGLAVVYTLVAVFAGCWGWRMFIVRSRMIEARSGRDLDNVVGPIVVCVGLTVALCLNFGFKVGICGRLTSWFDLQLTMSLVPRHCCREAGPFQRQRNNSCLEIPAIGTMMGIQPE